MKVGSRQRLVFHGAVVLMLGRIKTLVYALAIGGHWGDEPLREP